MRTLIITYSQSNFVKKITFLFVLLAANCVFAQESSIFSQAHDSSHFSVGVFSNYAVNSNALNNSFYKKAYLGGFISNDDKALVGKKLKNENRFGIDVNSGISFTQKIDTVLNQTGYGYFVSLRNCTHFDMSFSKDMFNVLMYGNEPYAGQSLNLGNFSASYVAYQQVQWGFTKTIQSDSAFTQYGLGLSYLNGQKNFTTRIEKADFFTEQNGDYLTLDIAGQLAQSDTTKGKFGSRSGSGFCADFFYHTIFENKSDLSVSIQNFGFISFSEQSPVYLVDSNFTFDGLEVDKLLTLKDSVLLAISKDTIVDNVSTHGSKGYSYTLPTTFTFNYTYIVKENKLQLTAGLITRIQANFRPMVYLSANYFICSKFVLIPLLSYGGYGNLSSGLAFQTDMGKGFVLAAGSRNIEGYIAPKKSTGQGLYFSLKKYF